MLTIFSATVFYILAVMGPVAILKHILNLLIFDVQRVAEGTHIISTKKPRAQIFGTHGLKIFLTMPLTGQIS